MVSPKDQYIPLNGLQLHYLEWGKSGTPTVLLLHGLMCHAHIWDDLAVDLSHQYHVLALDQRGHGDSGWSNQGFYNVDSHFCDIAQLIDALGLEQFILLGHSMGGRNALFYAACVPERVKQLILVDTRPGQNARAASELKRQLDCLPTRPESLDAASQAFGDLYPMISKEWRKYMAQYAYQEFEDGLLVSKYDTLMTDQLENAGYEAEDLRYLFGSIVCPTLIIRGEESLFLSREDAMEMARSIPNAVLKEIPRSTHMPAQENPEVFKKVIFEFLGR